MTLEDSPSDVAASSTCPGSSLSAVVLGEIPSPNGIELFFQRCNERRVVRDNPVLEVALAFRLRAHPGTGQVRTVEPGECSVGKWATEVRKALRWPIPTMLKRITLRIG